MNQVGVSRILICVGYGLAFGSPLTAIYAINRFVLYVSPLSIDLDVKPDMNRASEIFSSVSEDMSALAIGIFAVSVFLSRLSIKIRYRQALIWFLLVSFILCICSVYCGIKFRFDIGTQFYRSRFDFDIISSAILTQSVFLALQISVIIVEIYHILLFRDSRYKVFEAEI